MTSPTPASAHSVGHPTPLPATERDVPADIDAPVGVDDTGKVRQSTSGRVWAGIVISAVLLVLLVVFIAENSQNVTVKFLGFQGSVSLAIALIIAAVVGIVVVSIPGSVRLLQLRRAVKKNAQSLSRARG